MLAAFVGTGFELRPSVEGMKKWGSFMQEERTLSPLRVLSRFVFGQRFNFIHC